MPGVPPVRGSGPGGRPPGRGHLRPWEVHMVVGFLASRPGRWLRIVTGAGMVVGGLAAGTSRGAAVALVGLGPLVAAALDWVPAAALFGLPMDGPTLRRELGVSDEASLLEGLPRASMRGVSPTLH
ncbi:hypothetical protein BHS06_33520 [Myxococcus xanthus]|nr:hypothetical protein BHS06_33520 [Myxococcus xanthus]